jgi:hypothetical protein
MLYIPGTRCLLERNYVILNAPTSYTKAQTEQRVGLRLQNRIKGDTNLSVITVT